MTDEDLDQARNMLKELRKYGITDDDESRCLGLLAELVSEVDRLRVENQTALTALSASQAHGRYLESELYRKI